MCCNQQPVANIRPPVGYVRPLLMEILLISLSLSLFLSLPPSLSFLHFSSFSFFPYLSLCYLFSNSFFFTFISPLSNLHPHHLSLLTFIPSFSHLHFCYLSFLSLFFTFISQFLVFSFPSLFFHNFSSLFLSCLSLFYHFYPLTLFFTSILVSPVSFNSISFAFISSSLSLLPSFPHIFSLFHTYILSLSLSLSLLLLFLFLSFSSFSFYLCLTPFSCSSLSLFLVTHFSLYLPSLVLIISLLCMNLLYLLLAIHISLNFPMEAAAFAAQSKLLFYMDRFQSD